MDADNDGRWMSYSELAQFRGIDRQSAIRLAYRRRWRRRKDNRGAVTVFVPDDWLQRRDASPDVSSDTSYAIKVLEDALATLREQLAKAEQRAEKADRRAEEAEKRVETLIAVAAARRAAGRWKRVVRAWRGR